MEALVATVLLVVVIGAALAALARTWPRTSPLGGYRARQSGDRRGANESSRERDRTVQDDDEPWNWTKRE